MGDFLRHGGVFMWLSMASGLLAIAAAAGLGGQHARDRIALVRTLCVATLFFGFLGGGTGLIKLLQAVGQQSTPADPGFALLFKGLSEVLYNPMAGLVYCAFAALALAVSQVRRSSAEPPPHAQRA